MDRGAWWATVHGFTKSQTQLNDFQFSATLRLGFPGGATGKEPAYQCRRHNRVGFDPWVGKIPWRTGRQHIPVFLPGESPRTEEPGGLLSMGLQRVGHSCATKCSTALKEEPSHQWEQKAKVLM